MFSVKFYFEGVRFVFWELFHTKMVSQSSFWSNQEKNEFSLFGTSSSSQANKCKCRIFSNGTSHIFKILQGV